MFRQQKGITLIALVITIIVLLILAGVTIAMLSGENGILTRATEARVSSAIGDAKDAVGLAATEAVADYYNDVYVDGNTSDYNSAKEAAIKAAVSVSSSNVTITEETNGVKITYTGDDTKYATGTIDDNGALTWTNNY